MNRLWLGLFIMAALSIAACGSSSSTPTSVFIHDATEIPVPAPTTFAGQGAPHGQTLFMTTQIQAGFACITCHYVDSEARLIGPGLVGLSARVSEYRLDMSFEKYLQESILYPGNFIAPGEPSYKDGLMPSNYGEIFTEQELKDLIAYLSTL